jgi:hypothetical protein
MKIFLNLIGLLLTLASAITVSKGLASWRGALRDGMFFFILCFSFLATGFLWKVFVSATDSSIDLVFFSTGSVFLALGAKKFFSLNTAS